MLVEGVVLSLAGAAIGILLAYLGVRGIMAWLPAGLPRVADIGIDLRVLGAATAASALTGIFFGIVPALQSSRPDLTTALKDSGRSTTAGAGSQFLRSALVVAEVALAVVLLVGAGLFIGSFAKLMRIDPGFDYHNVLALNVGVKFEPGKWDEAAKRGALYSAATGRGRRPGARRRARSGRRRRLAADRQLEPQLGRAPGPGRAERRRGRARRADGHAGVPRTDEDPAQARAADHRRGSRRAARP